MFLMGIIMVSTGVCLILNYGYFDNALFPPELQSQEGKRTVGIILTVSGFAAVFISVLVSSIYLCSRNKTPAVRSEELNTIPNSGRKSSAGSRNKVAASNTATSAGKNKTSSNSAPSKSHPNKGKDMHSTAVPRPRHPRKRKKQRILQKSKLEGIQEADAVSRKFSEKDISSLDMTGQDDVHSEKNSQEGTLSAMEMQEEVFTASDNTVLVSSSNSVASSDDLPQVDNPAYVETEVIKECDQSSTSSGFTGSEKTDSLHKVEYSTDSPV
jgi:succinate dehydrogenase flavin-adding protein (antitoxin of CptAB toxin-antitoxin module)